MKHLSTAALCSLAFIAIHAEGNNTFIEVYPDTGSKAVGEEIHLHISSSEPTVKIEALTITNTPKKTVLATGLEVQEHTPPNIKPWRADYNWPISFSFTIPEYWKPGLHHIRVRSEIDPGYYKQFQIAVQPDELGSYSKIAVLTNDLTNAAYNSTGGKSNYKSFIPDDPKRANVLSINRPGTFNNKWRDFDFPKWADKVGMPIEYITSLDLHFNPGILNSYEILVLSGHSEYWSRPMRRELERFLNSGGKLVSLSGNTMWWSVRVLEAGRGLIMVSCKGWLNDPKCSDDPKLSTKHWHEIDPEIKVLGASYEYGGYVDSGGHYTQNDGYGGYFVESESNWLWKGTGTAKGSHVGQAEGIAGYEADSPPLKINAVGNYEVDYPNKDLPANIELLGITPAGKTDKTTGEIIEGHGTIIYFPFGNNGGAVFNCGSTDCSNKLGTDPVWHKAMLNVFTKMGASHTNHWDVDGDSVHDCNDNCVNVFNPDQSDSFGDGTGNACDQHCH